MLEVSMKRFVTGAALSLFLAGCTGGGPGSPAREFLAMYNDIDQKVTTVAAEASWKAATDVSEQHTGERIGASGAVAAFEGSRYVIDTTRALLAKKDALSDLERRQLNKILLNAAEAPGTIPEVVEKRVQTEARAGAILDGFVFCMDEKGGKCVKKTSPNEIDELLDKSRNMAARQKVWEVSKQTGPALKKSLTELRELRNRVATELGFSSYFHLQVADYGMSVAEMMQLMDRSQQELRPL
ncbi:MAG: hypothetical protein EXQ52_18920, partial [Bryobacterales bacterium]|nr:hypothetical protein [Bryobacterales bacterium]